MERLSIVILAAGKGERMQSSLPKVMHELIDRPLIDYVYEAAKSLGPERIVIVVGYGREKIIEHMDGKDVEFSVQEEQKGTAHALLSAENLILDGDVLVLYGDVPLVESSTLKSFIEFYRSHSSITFMVTEMEDPKGYGRVFLNGDYIDRIVEESEANEEEKKVKIVNTGLCVIPRNALPLLREINDENKKGEFYLTDLCKVAKLKGLKVRAYFHKNSMEVLGINTREELLFASEFLRQRIIEKLVAKGVFLLTRNVLVGSLVEIGKDTRIGNNAVILGRTVIGERVSLGSNVLIRDCIIEDDAKIGNFVLLEKCKIEKAQIIPDFFKSKKERTCVE